MPDSVNDKRTPPAARGRATVKVGAAPVRAQDSIAEAENRAKARRGAAFLGAVVAAYIVYLVATGQMSQFWAALSSVDSTWIAGATLCYALYFIFGVGAYAIAVYLDHDSPVGIRDLMSVEASGIFFGNLTPMMAGAVPSQIVRLTRTGLNVGEASATQFTRFIMFQLAVVLFAALMLVAKLGFFFEAYGDIVILNLVVFGVHFLELVGLFVVCLCPRLVMRFGNWAIALLARRGWLKSRAHWDEMVNVQVMEFSNAFKRAAQDLPSMGLTLLVTMAQLASLYTIPWFVLKAFGRSGDFLECLAAGSMVQMVATAVPLPGGTGGAEGGFAMFYGSMFGTAANAGFLVWRIVTFFAPTIISAPLLGLRTTNRTTSIYHRVQRLKGRLGHHGTPTSGRRGGGATLRPSGGSGGDYSPRARPGALPTRRAKGRRDD